MVCGRGWEWYWGVLVMDYLVLASVAEAVRGESGAQAAGSGAVAVGWLVGWLELVRHSVVN